MFPDKNNYSGSTSLNFSLLDDLTRFAFTKNDFTRTAAVVLFGILIEVTTYPGILFFYILLAFGALAIYFVKKHSNLIAANHEILAQFAAANNLIYTPNLSDDLIGAPGTLFAHGHSKKGSKALSGKFGKWPLTVFQYDYATGSGKSRRDYDAMVVEVELPRNMPHMVIDSLVEEGTGYGSVLPIEFDKSQKIDLEGDFYKYFALYAPDKYGISALTVIAPDAMQALLEHAALCDIEIIDNKLYFYWPEVASTRRHYEQLFGTVEAVLKEVGNKVSRGDIYATSAQAQVHSIPNAQGVRLKKHGLRLATILFAALYISGQVISEMDDPPPILIILVGTGFLVFAANALRRSMARKRLLSDLQQRYKNYRPT